MNMNIDLIKHSVNFSFAARILLELLECTRPDGMFNTNYSIKTDVSIETENKTENEKAA